MPSLRILFLFVASTLATMTLSLAVPESMDSTSIRIEKRNIFNEEALIKTLKEQAEAKEEFLKTVDYSTYQPKIRKPSGPKIIAVNV
ncbi:hypothetical protein J132_11012 [Termitomyces sp. J132]|nr:hypothetical protein H2248_001435 [Termitomyces sp. 'cryptogamus']KNZ81659.1 hypothetical protein J132_11012 [Termitomyces sp. J132]